MSYFNIGNFKASLINDGVIRSNRYELIFNPPVGMPTNFDLRDILIRCETASIPPVWFATDDNLRRYGYGPLDKAPTSPQFDPFNCQFLADKNGLIHGYFTDWMNLIANFDSSNGIYSENSFR